MTHCFIVGLHFISLIRKIISSLIIIESCLARRWGSTSSCCWDWTCGIYRTVCPNTKHKATLKYQQLYIKKIHPPDLHWILGPWHWVLGFNGMELSGNPKEILGLQQHFCLISFWPLVISALCFTIMLCVLCASVEKVSLSTEN